MKARSDTAEDRTSFSLSHSAKVGLLRDFTDALGQQMFFWGRDVLHPRGNLLCHFGFDRRKSQGLDGTSCYRMDYEEDFIELHGACVGRYSKSDSGFLFVRNRKTCFLYGADEAPDPGFYAKEFLRTAPVSEMFDASLRFLQWWLEYEAWVHRVTESGYRDRCFRMFRKLPKSKPWLTPDQARKWLRSYAESPETLTRARSWKQSNSPSL
ncbi:MAG: hypothetical protein AAF733_01355 [Verrucomicrobiota bacterium]